jgi:hypothetical protein
MKYYTIGEIFREKLLIGRNGPYKDKSTISRAMSQFTHRVILTKHGPGKEYTLDQIERANKKTS